METTATGETGGKDLVAELLASGKTLPADLRSRFLAQGTANVPRLLQLLEHLELADQDSPGRGWAPIHAVELLIELRVTEAVPPMLRALEQTDWYDILHDRILVRLPEMGAAVLEPALDALDRNDDDDLRHSLCGVLAELGVQDERVYKELCTLFAQDPSLGASCFGAYGDARALPLLEQALWDYEPDWTTPTALIGLADLEEAYEQLGGTLPEELRLRVKGFREIRRVQAQAPSPSARAARIKVGRAW